MEEYESTGFAPGSKVLIETDDTMKLAVVIQSTGDGLLIHQTHRLEVVGHMTTSEAKKVQESLEKTSTKLLRTFAKEAGVGYVARMRMSRDELIRFNLNDYINEYNEKSTGQALVRLARPIQSWIPMERMKEVTSSEDFLEENTLKPLDFETPSVVESKDDKSEGSDTPEAR